MIKKLLGIIILVCIYYGAKTFIVGETNIQAESTALTGIILVSAYLFALIVNKWTFPKLTGYMLMGIILGPAGINFLDHKILGQLKFLESMALSFIAITAGGEFKFKTVSNNLKSVSYLLSGQIILVFGGLLTLIIVLSPSIPFLAKMDENLLMGFAIIFAGVAISKSPATTIGIITELDARGKVTELVLNVTVVKSIFLVIIFPLIIFWSKFYLIEGTTFNLNLVLELLINIGGSISIGVIIGLIIILYLKYVGKEKTIFLLGVSIIITVIGSMLDFEILLISIFTGIVVENFSKQGDSLIHTIEQSSLPLYIIFFCFAGAGLHLETLKSAFTFTAILVVLRLILIYAGNSAGAFFAKEGSIIKKYSWLGFIGQAGIAVGLATIIENSFPGAIGNQIKTILIASVVINEFLGPILFKYLLIKSKEANDTGV